MLTILSEAKALQRPSMGQGWALPSIHMAQELAWHISAPGLPTGHTHHQVLARPGAAPSCLQKGVWGHLSPPAHHLPPLTNPTNRPTLCLFPIQFFHLLPPGELRPLLQEGLAKLSLFPACQLLQLQQLTSPMWVHLLPPALPLLLLVTSWTCSRGLSSTSSFSCRGCSTKSLQWAACWACILESS